MLLYQNAISISENKAVSTSSINFQSKAVRTGQNGTIEAIKVFGKHL